MNAFFLRAVQDLVDELDRHSAAALISFEALGLIDHVRRLLESVPADREIGNSAAPAQ